VVNWVLTRMDKGGEENFYHVTFLGLNAIHFVPDREHNELPLENWMLCTEITTVCCETNMVHIHTYIHTHTHTYIRTQIQIYKYKYLYIYNYIYITIHIMCTKKQVLEF
jgi:hypothetical protein